ncbi:MAG: Rnf-Nqr domain containing protein [Gammaproteobacteria bacterium]
MINPMEKALAPDIYITTLGACPLLVAASSVQSGWAMGLVFLTSIVLVSLCLSVIRKLVPVALRLTAMVLISATMLALIHVFLQVWFYESSLKLGIYVPLIAMNCLVLAQAEEHALRITTLRSCRQALATGTGILLGMLVLGAVREYSALPLLQQPPGAFLLLALVIAGIQWFAARTDHIGSAT